jgi:probable F420-dependent oxidoreductase
MKFSNAMIGVDPLMWPELAKAAEDAGFDSVAVSDHVLLPQNLRSKYPYTPDGTPQFSPDELWMDPMSAISAMAQTTETLRFVTNVFVLPLRNPFVVAKSVATAAYLSRGRVELGIGAGWMKEEFELLEQPFSARGRRMEEMIEVMRALWSGENVGFEGEFYNFEPVRMMPGIEGSVPVHIGGASEIALRRAARIGDGWLGMYGSPQQIVEQCRTLSQYREEAGTADRPFEIIASPLAMPSADLVEELEAAGLTTILTSAWLTGGVKSVDSVEQGVELLQAYGDRFIH